LFSLLLKIELKHYQWPRLQVPAPAHGPSPGAEQLLFTKSWITHCENRRRNLTSSMLGRLVGTFFGRSWCVLWLENIWAFIFGRNESASLGI